MQAPKKNRDAMRQKAFHQIFELLKANFDDVLQTANNELMFPVVDDEHFEMFVNVVVKIPLGAKGEEYDGFEEAKDYQFKLEEKKRLEIERAIAHEKKIQQDTRRRAFTSGE